MEGEKCFLKENITGAKLLRDIFMTCWALQMTPFLSQKTFSPYSPSRCLVQTMPQTCRSLSRVNQKVRMSFFILSSEQTIFPPSGVVRVPVALSLAQTSERVAMH